MSYMGDVKSKFFETTTAAGDAVIAVAARPTTTFTLTTGMEAQLVWELTLEEKLLQLQQDQVMVEKLLLLLG
jgi:hypothetical protein